MTLGVSLDEQIADARAQAIDHLTREGLTPEQARAALDAKIEMRYRHFARWLEAGAPDTSDRVGDQALTAILSTVGNLADAHPRDLGIEGQAGRSNPLRVKLRMLPCLMPDVDDLDELTGRIQFLIHNPNLPRYVIREALVGFDNEVPVRTWQQLAKLILAGVQVREAAERCGVNHKVAEKVSTFIGAVQAKEQRLASAAVDAAAKGHTIAQFREAHGIGRNLAQRLLAEAKDILDEVGE